MNDPRNGSDILVPITFADVTNLFYSQCNIKSLFTTVYEELYRISQWLKANKLSFNIYKTKSIFFSNLVKDNIPLNLPELKIANKMIERKSYMKFFGGNA